MEKQMKWGLKAKGPVCEQTFLDYLDKVCKEEDLKQCVLAFYERLKEEDKKDGPTICKESFGTPAKIFLNGQVFDYDFNKYLFANGEKIGKADFFRYQFLNFVEDVSYCQENVNRGGYFSFVHKKVVINKNSLLNIQTYLKNINKEHFQELLNKKLIEDEFYEKYWGNNDIDKIIENTKRRIVFHELTHVLSVKSLDDGKVIELIHPSYIQSGNRGLMSMSRSLMTYKETKDAYFSGMTILNEIFTELYAEKKYFKVYLVNKNKAKYSPKDVVNGCIDVGKLKYYFVGKYVELSYFAKMFETFDFWGKPEKYLLNPLLVRNNYFTPFMNSNIAKEIDEGVYNYFVKIIEKNNPNVDKKLLKENISKISAYDCFVILMGEMSRNFDNNNTIHYGELGRLAQTILLYQYKSSLNFKFNHLLSVKKNNNEIKTQQELQIDKQKAKKLLIIEAENVKYLKKWIIKNNFTVQTPGYDSRVVRPSDELCEHDFAKIEGKNMINIRVWNEYIKMLVNTAKKVSPELLKTDKFLAREYLSFEKEKELNK